MKYRADIDGFRSIAVLLVILFHFELGNFSGGFIGVDIFFVLSGYLISSIVFEQIRNSAFSFSGFYFRRIRRLFPVYVLVMLCTFIAAYWIMLPQDFREFGKSLLASTFYISNILFYLSSGYFDTASHLKPLLHTWSLSVEEQFYLIFPLLAWLLAKLNSRHLFSAFLLLTVVSFTSAIYYIQLDESAAFYLYPFRAWEMFLGTLIALKPLPISRSALTRQISASIGILCIAIPSFTYTPSTLFPGWAALLPCLGTMIIIDSSKLSKTWLSNTLSRAPFVYIGKISYSLYLWHWPVFVLYSYSKPNGTDIFDTLLMLALTFAASVLGYLLIEKPTRSGNIRLFKTAAPTYLSTLALSIVLAGLGLFVYKKDGLPSRLDPQIATLALATSDFLKDTSHCFESDNSAIPGLDYCEYGKPLEAENYVLVIGDSHAGAMMPGVKKAFLGSGVDVLQIWFAGCPPIFGIEKDESVSSTIVDQECTLRNQRTKQFIEENQNRISSIVIIGRWTYYVNGGGIGYDQENSIAIWEEGSQKDEMISNATAMLSAFDKTLRSLNSLNKKIFVVEQPPEISNFMGRTLAIELITGQQSYESALADLAFETLSSVNARQGVINQFFEDQMKAGNLSILKTHEYFCDSQKCSAFIGDTPGFADNNHLSAEGSRKISDMFQPVIVHFSEQVQP